LATLAESLVSSAARKLPIRKRPDLSARLHRYQGRAYWVVKEPVGLNYFRFQEEEFAILNMLDGHSSLDDIKEQFEKEFPPQKITVEELQQFIGMLHRSGLVITGAPGQGVQLKKRRDERKRKEMLGKFANVLAIRFKGVDPERLLTWMDPKFRFVFTKWGVAAWFITCISALLLVAAQFDIFQSKLPSFHQFFGPQNWFWIGLTLMLTKICHEFGHGLSCKHFGGECHELGVMILVLTPCLYCNVSDSWMLPSKWRRAMIGAAGMYVELFIASICTFIWWNTSPGLLNNLALSTMFVCSVSTVVFNANPLLRYDGYYILADLVEIPNLRQKSTKILNTWLGKICLGLEEPEDPFLPKRNKIFFILYTLAAVCYRWFVLFSILYFLYQIFKPYNLEIVGFAIGMMSLVGLVGVPAWKVGKFFYIPGRIDRVKKPRMYATLGVLAVVVALLVFLPLPHRILGTVDVRPYEGRPVVVEHGGELLKIYKKPGEEVKAGEVIVELRNKDLEVQLAQAEYERDLAAAQLEDLHFRSGDDPIAESDIPRARVRYEDALKVVAERTQELEDLKLRAPRDGIVLPPPSQNGQPRVEGGLATMTGTIFDKHNTNAMIPAKYQVCQVGDKQRWEAVIYIDQTDFDFVAPDQYAKIRLEQFPLMDIETEIRQVDDDPLKEVPKRLSSKAGGAIATETNELGREKPQSTTYQAVSQELTADFAPHLRVGLKGEAKISVASMTVAERFSWFLRQTFNFRL
jgi:putative peptide zinc metalloprotease protein